VNIISIVMSHFDDVPFSGIVKFKEVYKVFFRKYFNSKLYHFCSSISIDILSIKS